MTRAKALSAAAIALLLAVSGAAFAQDAAPAGELSEADMNASPFPPGPHAAVVKKVCTECHMAQVILDRKFTPDEAVRYYKVMVSSDIETEQAKQIIEYLSTTLGR